VYKPDKKKKDRKFNVNIKKPEGGVKFGGGGSVQGKGKED